MDFDNSKRALPVAVVSSCQMVQGGLRALLNDGPFTLAWHDGCHQESVMQQLHAQPVGLLILSLNVYQTNLLQGIHLVQVLQVTHPSLRLLVVLDVTIPYLVTCLRGWGVEHIINLRHPLGDWQRQLLIANENAGEQLVASPGKGVLADNGNPLSEVESRVMQYLVQGFSVQEIATLMTRSVKTICSQKCNALNKMGISHCAQLMAIKPVFMDNLNGPVAAQWSPHDLSLGRGGWNAHRFY